MGALLSGLGSAIAGMFSASMVWLGVSIVTVVVVTTTNVGSWIVGTVLEGLVLGIVDLSYDVANAAVSILPDAPAAPPVQLEAVVEFVAFANRYLPVAEAFGILPVVLAVVTAVGTWKLARFVRG